MYNSRFYFQLAFSLIFLLAACTPGSLTLQALGGTLESSVPEKQATQMPLGETSTFGEKNPVLSLQAETMSTPIPDTATAVESTLMPSPTTTSTPEPTPTAWPETPLKGYWKWIGDSDGTTPSQGAECVLAFYNSQIVDLNCSMPNEDYSDSGVFTVENSTFAGGKISLELPDTGISIHSTAYTIANQLLTLPFTLINGVEGTSQWKVFPKPEIDSQDFVAVAFDAYNTALLDGASEGWAAETAVAALQQREFVQEETTSNLLVSYSPGSPPPETRIMVSKPLKSVILNEKKTVITVKKENGRVYFILLNQKGPMRPDYSTAPPEKPLAPGFFSNDPRTQLFMKPNRGPDDPVQHTALLLFPMLSLKQFKDGKTFSFKGYGEDPEVLRKYLLQAGYPAEGITAKVDDEVTINLIAAELLKNPGVFYITTHSGWVELPGGDRDFVMATGTQVIPRAGQSDDDAGDEAWRNLHLPDYLSNIPLITTAVETGRFQHALFLCIGKDFFQALTATGKWDMSHSLVYLDACASTAVSGSNPAATPIAVDYFKAAALVGWKANSEARVSIGYSQHFFGNLARKTHSVREVWDETRRVLKSRQWIYDEDKFLDNENVRIRELMVDKNDDYEVFGLDGKRYHYLGDGYYSNTKPDIVFWLVWLGRWNQDADIAAQNLLSCYNNVWKKGGGGLGAGPLCNAGIVGSHSPTENEVKEARQLINGQPGPIPGGRWTLADQLPYSK